MVGRRALDAEIVGPNPTLGTKENGSLSNGLFSWLKKKRAYQVRFPKENLCLGAPSRVPIGVPSVRQTAVLAKQEVMSAWFLET